MQQVLFHFPLVGFPLYGFGAMLLLSFFVVILWGRIRAPKVGLPWERFQDMSMLLLATGIIGARIVYMIQYYDYFPDRSPWGLLIAFVSIWDGGIVFYGSIFGGVLGYLFFRHFVIKRLGVNGWQLADAVAPMLAIGMAIGRIGCYLNGCCWGQVACPECQPMPLTAEMGQFPLIPSHARKQVTRPADEKSQLPFLHGLQTTTGFSIQPREQSTVTDARSVVAAIEPGTAAAESGLKPGDKILELNGRPNRTVLEINGPPKAIVEVQQLATMDGITVQTIERSTGEPALIISASDPSQLAAVRGKLAPLRGQISMELHDTLYEHVRSGPLGEKQLGLVVERNGQEVPIQFTPRTVTFFPTQLYETISMVLLTFLLLAYQPFRRHDGQVMVLLMLGYSVHRYLNEAIRIEPMYSLGLTLSQWISVGIFAAGIVLELYLRWSQPKLPRGLIPLGYGAKPTPEAVKS